MFFLQQLKTYLENGTNRNVGFTVQDGTLLYKGRIVIPRTSQFTKLLLQEYHGSPVGGAGEIKTYLRLASEWHWTGMRKDVTRFVQMQSCEICQKSKLSQQSPAGLLQPLPIPLRCGRTSQWISSKVSRILMAWTRFW